MKIQFDYSRNPAFRKHSTDAGYDLPVLSPDSMMNENGPWILPASGICVVNTGVRINIPKGFWGLVKERSSVGRLGVQVLSGVIDAGFTGEIRIVIVNHSRSKFTFNQGDRLAQIIIMELPEIYLEQSDWRTWESERGEAGFGSTGV